MAFKQVKWDFCAQLDRIQLLSGYGHNFLDYQTHVEKKGGNHTIHRTVRTLNGNMCKRDS